MEHLIGHTPMIKINYRYRNEISSIYVKVEYYNLTGSIKDRIVYHILKKAKIEGTLKDGQPIVEATSGNTGIALSAIGACLGHPVFIFMPDWVSSERLKLMQSFGANVFLYSADEGGFTRAIEEAKNKQEELQAFTTDQFRNKDNVMCHYTTTGYEILNVMQPRGIGGFVSGIGTGGTLMGIGKRLKEYDHEIVLAGMEPAKMPLISGGKIIGNHKIEGIGDDFIPDIVDLDLIDEVFVLDDEDAINMSRRLAQTLGLGVGISSGANFLSAILLNEKKVGNVVTVFADDNKKYLSTDLVKSIDLNETFLSNQVELINYEFVS